MAGSGVGLVGSGLTSQLEKLAFLGIGSHESCYLKGSRYFLGSLPGAHFGSGWSYPRTPSYHMGQEGGPAGISVITILLGRNDASMGSKSVPRGHGLSGHLCHLPSQLSFTFTLLQGSVLGCGTWMVSYLYPEPKEQASCGSVFPQALRFCPPQHLPAWHF